MSSRHALLLVLFSLWGHLSAVAQLAGTPPKCALSCIVPSNYQGCTAADTRCLCANPTVVKDVQSCIRSNCTNASDQSAALAFVQQECQTLTESPSGSAAATTRTATVASQATDASFGNSASPQWRPTMPQLSLLSFVIILLP